MRIYLYEMVSGGGAFLPSSISGLETCLDGLDDFHQVPNLISDGSRMLTQLVQLFLQMPEAEIWVSVDSRLQTFGRQLQTLNNLAAKPPVVLFADPVTPWAVFEECCRGADKTILIAPELGALLETAAAKCVIAGGTLLGADRQLRKLGIDKIELHQWAEEHDILMPVWGTLVDGEPSLEVVPSKTICKPVRGTGGVGVRFADNNLPDVGTWLLEEEVPGIAVSVAAVVTEDGPILLPPCYQQFGGEFGFEFRNAEIVDQEEHIRRAWNLADEVFRSLPLEESRGWIGLDLILGEHVDEDVLIEVNPRITSTIDTVASLAEFNPYQWDRSTNVRELMFAAAMGK